MSESVSTENSKLSQFGIYKGIDARTEEFLRLSKRRQIRQGCACAVLSTIITVIIVAIIVVTVKLTEQNNAAANHKIKRQNLWIDYGKQVAFEPITISTSNLTSANRAIPLIRQFLTENENLLKSINPESESKLWNKNLQLRNSKTTKVMKATTKSSKKVTDNKSENDKENKKLANTNFKNSVKTKMHRKTTVTMKYKIKDLVTTTTLTFQNRISKTTPFKAILVKSEKPFKFHTTTTSYENKMERNNIIEATKLLQKPYNVVPTKIKIAKYFYKKFTSAVIKKLLGNIDFQKAFDMGVYATNNTNLSRRSKLLIHRMLFPDNFDYNEAINNNTNIFNTEDFKHDSLIINENFETLQNMLPKEIMKASVKPKDIADKTFINATVSNAYSNGNNSDLFLFKKIPIFIESKKLRQKSEPSSYSSIFKRIMEGKDGPNLKTIKRNLAKVPLMDILMNVILLIYEYSVVKSKISRKKGEFYDSNVTNDTPVADRLDRSYFGFDQDYFERMPLLVNALQDNNNQEKDIPVPIKTDKRGKFMKLYHNYPYKPHYDLIQIRRTSPRPFIFEYRSPPPAPFNKLHTSRSWVENYRNAQRLKNLEQVINYLEKTINAKFGDLYSFPSSTHIAFSGVYVQPPGTKADDTLSPSDLVSQGSDNIQKVHKGHQHQPSDVLFSYKPERPGDVNLLADAPLKFASPHPFSLVPMFRPASTTKGCVGIRCSKQKKIPNLLNIVSGSAEIKSTNPSLFDKANTYNLIMNLLPMPTTPEPYLNVLTTAMPPLDQIYFTTSRPEFQFKRKTMGPPPKPMLHRRRHKTRTRKAQKKMSGPVEFVNPVIPEMGAANMILHVKVFPKAGETTTDNPPAFTPNALNSTQVEDYHVGSSGIIPISHRSTTTSLPKVNLTPFFEESSSEEIRAWSSTQPPDILKFNQEDAKVPDQYQRIKEIQDSYRNYQPDIDRRNSQESLQIDSKPSEDESYYETTTAETMNESTDEPVEIASVKTYVPQINGHSRHININSRNINNWINENSEKRKSKLEFTQFAPKTYVPTYVEIRRNKIKS